MAEPMAYTASELEAVAREARIEAYQHAALMAGVVLFVLIWVVLDRTTAAAFAVGAIDYLIDTVAPEARTDMERGSLEAWSKESQWHGLDIVETVDGKPGDEIIGRGADGIESWAFTGTVATGQNVTLTTLAFTEGNT